MGFEYNLEMISTHSSLTLKVPETKISEFANSIDLDEVAHHDLAKT